MPAAPESTPTTEPGRDTPLVSSERVPAAIEALLLTSDRPIPTSRLLEALGLDSDGDSKKQVESAIGSLNTQYEKTGRSFRIETVAGGFRLMTLPEFAPVVAAMQGLRESTRLSRAAIETLAIVAYRQPATRAQIEAIRGVACGEVLKTLIERRLITIVGRAEELGRPMLYGTSKQFLEAFGLSSVRDLPTVDADSMPEPLAAIPEPKPEPAAEPSA
ncbi:MAG: SMC-Scp complex subunit ScpB [Phycisphaeraceae bacterium]|nr:SMC-Scp complex subunit ScpB [Phycisphaerales bacterium]MCB9842198.1 SMC-Scp complex subunit ScpB [Phycisphaeraceae bacterium]